MSTERYQNGVLLVEEFAIGGDRVRLTFYPDGRLKAEERFGNGQVMFGRYYLENGTLERSIGELPQRPAWLRGSQSQSQ
jgi:antitoxin component YwqK of YwqJK toxin-antitoxin module